MALPDFTGQNIENTYQRVLHTDGTTLFNGTGSIVGSINAEFNSLIVNGNAQFENPVIFVDGITMQGNINTQGNISASGTITARDIINHSNTTSGLRFNPSSTDVLSNLIVTGSITASGNISSSGIITATSFVGIMDGGFF